MDRIILHCDLDCFFAAVEARDNPEYKGKPIIIGADPKRGNGRGVVSTCSYEARKFGIHSALPISQAYRLCPEGIYLKPSHDKYITVSNQVMSILKSYSDKFQQAGIDEAYIDITESIKDFKEGKIIADSIRERVYKEIGITISIGVAPTKSIAKIASDHEKPNSTTVVPPNLIFSFLKNQEITRIPGIGKKSKIYYNTHRIKTIGDIIVTPLEKMIELFGKNGKWAWNIAHGNDNREVGEFHGNRKSISKERTFHKDTNEMTFIIPKLEELNEKIHYKLSKNKVFYKTITIKIRFEGFITHTRSKTFPFHIRNEKTALKVLLELYQEFNDIKKKVRLIGVRFSNLKREIKQKQITLFNYNKYI